MSSYGLGLMRGIAEGVVPVSDDVRLRFVARSFPGALPYELFRGDDLVGLYESQEAFKESAGTQAWTRMTVLRPEGIAFSDSLCGEYHAQYGKVDWPEPRAVLVGEVNPYQDRQPFDLYDEPERASGHRLRSLVLGVRRETYFRRFARHNLCVGKWRASAARDRAIELAAQYPTEILVLLGRNVQDSFGVRSVDPIWGRRPGAGPVSSRAVCLPHPSGLCRVWNESGAIDHARTAILSSAPDLRPFLGEVDHA